MSDIRKIAQEIASAEVLRQAREPFTAGLPPKVPAINSAENACKKIAQHIAEFEQSLTKEQEAGVEIIGGLSNRSFRIEKYYNMNSDFIILEVIDGNGNKARLIQHVSQISIVLTALPKVGSEARRIGFL